MPSSPVTPVCSICIPNFNGMEVIDECIRSVLNQQGQIPIEIIVHDDASTDGSADHIAKHYPQATLLRSETTVGFCLANRRMADIAVGRYLLLLNNDAALFPDALSHLLEASREREPSVLGLPQYQTDTGELIDRGCLLDPFLNPIPNLKPHCLDVGFIMGACLWLPRTLWHELEGFPPFFGSLSEDLLLCTRARLAGHPVRVLPHSGYFHHVGHSFGGGKPDAERRLASSVRRRALSERNKTFVMLATYPLPLLLAILPVHLGLLLLEGLVLALLKRDFSLLRRIYLPVVPQAWTQRVNLLKLRQSIQRRRTIGLTRFLSVFSPWPHKLLLLWRFGVPRLR